jgi:acyl carrier protein
MIQSSHAQLDAARALVASALDRPIESIPFDGDIDTLPSWDSIGHVQIVLAIENELGRPLDTTALTRLRSVADVARLLTAHIRVSE